MTIIWSRSPNNLEQDRQLSLQALDQWMTIKYQQTKSGIYWVSTIITTALEMTRMALISLTMPAINSLLTSRMQTTQRLDHALEFSSLLAIQRLQCQLEKPRQSILALLLALCLQLVVR